MLTFTVNVNKLRRISTVFLCSFFRIRWILSEQAEQ